MVGLWDPTGEAGAAAGEAGGLCEREEAGMLRSLLRLGLGSCV
jgi:hypothetical protein